MRLRKVLKLSPLFPKWRNMLNFGAWGVLGLYFALSKVDDEIAGIIGALVLLGIIVYLNKQEDFRPFDFFIQAHYPLVAIAFISSLTALLFPGFYDKWDNYFQVAVLIAFAWIFARWVSSKKQQEELKMATLRNTELDRLVAERTAELTRQKNELQETVKLLQATQAQLIQQEKLASLGELTAGIAHEIQNPLNFVNNFSEVSMELIDEMEEELNKGDKDEAIAIAGDIKQNLEKIIHHGRRADGIVKGMLQHSRASSDTREPTNINTLADEYFRLAYHGLRAKDKSFNAELVMDFAPNLPQVTVVPQDIGRVLLNLFTNAFYATQQKQKTSGPDYKPTVTVSTALIGKNIRISVKDNGSGIPDNIKEKIMQPFFTTKPAGEGTGLGLSLSYDIVVKSHGGKIDLDSRQGEYTEFVITIPA